ncbi:MAG: hypothetical protein VKJ04_04605 [Vampirovibrionales bacterium]|nr:hypothetical protein [Vampirovibrionales bacterium]
MAEFKPHSYCPTVINVFLLLGLLLMLATGCQKQPQLMEDDSPIVAPSAVAPALDANADTPSPENIPAGQNAQAEALEDERPLSPQNEPDALGNSDLQNPNNDIENDIEEAGEVSRPGRTGETPAPEKINRPPLPDEPSSSQDARPAAVKPIPQNQTSLRQKEMKKGPVKTGQTQNELLKPLPSDAKISVPAQ